MKGAMMRQGNLIARDAEIKRLDQCMREKTAQLVIVCGRRRVGKTFLINEYFEGRFDFKITGAYKEKREVQLRNFAYELSDQTRTEQATPGDWTEAFHLLRNYFSGLPADEKHVFFFDEMPWFDTPHSGFLAAFEHFWNDFGSAQHNFVCIVCGSAASWMTKNITNNKGGLFKRHTCSIYLKPFTLKETEEYLASRGFTWLRYDIAECYMIIGGIAYYLSLLEPDRSLVDNVDNLFFRKRAELWNEFGILYNTLFANSAQHIKIVEALSSKKRGLTRKEIAKAADCPENGDLTNVLRDLVSSDFVRIDSRFGKKNESCYQLKDYYSLFYFRFIKDYHGRDEHYWSHSYGGAKRNAWLGNTYEQVCKDHIQQIKNKIGIAAVLSEESTWSLKGDDDKRGAQIDLIIDRRDHVINLCEIKYSEKEYEISKDYDAILRNKRETFREHTLTKKTIQFVMITTYGVKPSKYSGSISKEITLDDMFF